MCNFRLRSIEVYVCLCLPAPLFQLTKRSYKYFDSQWASYQISKIEDRACTGNAGNCPRDRLQRKPLVSDPGMHHGTCVTHVPWCMSGSLTRGGGENVPGSPGACACACATRNFTYLSRGPCQVHSSSTPQITGTISWINNYISTCLQDITMTAKVVWLTAVKLGYRWVTFWLHGDCFT